MCSAVTRQPTARPSSTISPVTRERRRRSSAERRGWDSIAPHTACTSALPVPHVKWKRGTELPSPKLPRSAQLTTGKNFTPSWRNQPPTSSRARVTYCSAQRRGQVSSGSNSAIRSQSSSASASVSGMRERRCSGESTMNMPPNASRASPPISCGSQRSSSSTVCPLRNSSSVLTRPASPAPTTITSGVFSVMGGCLQCTCQKPPVKSDGHFS